MHVVLVGNVFLIDLIRADSLCTEPMSIKIDELYALVETAK